MKRLGMLLTLLWMAGAGSASGQLNLPTGKPKGPTVEARLLANRTAIVAGKPVELAIAFKIDEGWHIYWRSSGEGGFSTTFKWQLPDGFKVDPVQYPVPTRHVDMADAHTFILEGSPVFLTTLQVPANVPLGAEVTIGVDVKWLVCSDHCQPGDRSLALKLRVVIPEDTKPDNESLFAAARSKIPLPEEKAKYLKALSAVASVKRVRPGDAFKVAVVFDIQDDHHLNAHQPLSKALIPTDVFHDNAEAEGLQIERVIFPPGQEEPGPVPGEKVSIYRGQVAVILPVQADGKLEKKELRISGIATYQACNDKTKKCFAPTAAEWSLTLPVASADEKVTQNDLRWFVAATSQPGLSEASQERSKPPGAATRPAMAAVTDSAPRIGPPTTSESIWGRMQAALLEWGLVGYLLMALIGGFLLNLMPCVLPVISIKILSFVQQAKENRVRVLTLGLAFAGGILVSFMALGVLIIVAGQQWGGLFQSPHFVIIMCTIVTAFALSLFGVFALQPPRLVNNLGARVQQEGHLNAFGMGLLATALGTACTAPFLGLVLALATRPGQSTTVGMLIFVFAGIGMSAPYVVLAAYPAWLRVIPRPGPWMETFERIMGFLLLATVVWLLNSVQQQLGGSGLFWTIAFLLFVAVASWLYGKAGLAVSTTRRLLYYGCTVLAIVLGWRFCYSGESSIAQLRASQRHYRQMLARTQSLEDLDYSKAIPWLVYTPEKAMQAVQQGYTIFVDYTASWCVNCRQNEKLFIDTPEVREAMQRLGVRPFQADFSDRDPDLQKDLDKYGRGGVPMYLILPAGRPNDVILLDEVFVSSQPIIDGLEKAGPSRNAAALVMSSGPRGTNGAKSGAAGQP